MSLLVWNPDNILELELATRLNFNLFDNAEIVTGPLPTDVTSLAKDTRIKIVIKYWWLWEGTNEPGIDLSWADLVIFYTGELINGPWDWYYKRTVEQFKNKNFISIADTTKNLLDFPKYRVYNDLGNWFSRMVDELHFQEWNISKDKIKIFDALLGASKPHRNFVYRQLRKHNLLDKSFVNIIKKSPADADGYFYPNGYDYQSPDLHLFDDPAITDVNRRLPTGNNLPGLANGTSVSIPIKIYQNSWYSIVAETSESDSLFFTEKTAKPLYIKKLFVMFGAQGMLKKLHQKGYRTFDGIIDESYDQEPDDLTRWSMAFDQVIKLSQFDHEEVYKEIAPILIHNHNHICDHRYRLAGLKSFLDQALAHHVAKINRFDLLNFQPRKDN